MGIRSVQRTLDECSHQDFDLGRGHHQELGADGPRRASGRRHDRRQREGPALAGELQRAPVVRWRRETVSDGPRRGPPCLVISLPRLPSVRGPCPVRRVYIYEGVHEIGSSPNGTRSDEEASGGSGGFAWYPSDTSRFDQGSFSISDPGLGHPDFSTRRGLRTDTGGGARDRTVAPPVTREIGTKDRIECGDRRRYGRADGPPCPARTCRPHAAHVRLRRSLAPEYRVAASERLIANHRLSHPITLAVSAPRVQRSQPWRPNRLRPSATWRSGRSVRLSRAHVVPRRPPLRQAPRDAPLCRSE